MRPLALALLLVSGCAASRRAAAFNRGTSDAWSLVRRIHVSGEDGADEFLRSASRRDIYLLGVFSVCTERAMNKTQQAWK